MDRRLIAGIDEAGRGPLAGPVVAAAVILGEPIEGLADSKQLTRTQREELEPIIMNRAVGWAVGMADVDEIDRLNILHATFLAMRRAIEGLRQVPEMCLVDGNRPIRGLSIPQRTIVDGDAKEPAISAASILAKVHRDRLMVQHDLIYPGYGFADHKGYYCPVHIAALDRLGPCEIHRRSFSPVRERLEQGVLFG
jgi:ribonuclease HII